MSKPEGPWTRRIAGLTLVVALLVLLAGPLINFGVVPWQVGLATFALGAILAGIGGIVCLVALLRRRGGTRTVIAAAAGLTALAVPAAIVIGGLGAPPINDITTDTANPPAYVAITPALRGAGAAPVTYDPKITPQQLAAYPDLKPLDLAEPPAAAFARALAAAKAMGWAIVASDAAAGRIEATAKVPWWGFKDDIVIRLAPTATGTRVDIRSKSRVGEGDVGVNAQRIRDYFGKLRA